MGKRDSKTNSSAPKRGTRGGSTRESSTGEGSTTDAQRDDAEILVPRSEHGDPSERTVLSLIRDIREGRRTGEMLHRDDRMRVVEHLTAEGYSGAEISEVLKVSERTVIRDRNAIRELNALLPSPELVGQVVGQLVRSADQAAARLRRIARDPNAKPADKIEAEKASWQVQRECVVTMQGLGYLPTAPTTLNAHISSGDDVPQTEALLSEIERLESLPAFTASDGTPIVSGELVELKSMLTRTFVAERLGSVSRDASSTSHAPSRASGNLLAQEGGEP